MIQKRRTLRHFGIDSKGVYRSAEHDLYIQDIRDAVDDRQIHALVGRFGSGKSTIARMAINEMLASKTKPYRFVYIDSADLERLSIATIIECSITDLSNERPYRTMLARSRQSRRILGELARSGEKICLIIDNAHRLHANTLLALKDEHEKEYMGLAPLFSILYIGQPKLVDKLSANGEVFWRTLITDLHEESSNWMSYSERVKYLEAVYGPAINHQARERIAQITEGPLHMEFVVTEKMETARAAGKRVVDGDVVQLSFADRRKALGLSLGDLSHHSDIPKTTLHEVEKGVNQKLENKQKLEAALEALEVKAFGSHSQAV